jgi:hypothetical protein
MYTYTRKFGVSPSFKEHFLSRRAKPSRCDSQLFPIAVYVRACGVVLTSSLSVANERAEWCYERAEWCYELAEWC